MASSAHIWQPLGYLLVFLGMLFEGDEILFGAIFLIHQGFLAVLPASFILVSGALIGDALWFAAGRKMRGSERWFKRLFDKMARRFDRFVRQKPTEMLFVSKFIYGMHRAILLRYGESDISFRKYMSRDLVATFFWMAVVALVAIGASSYAAAFDKDIKIIGKVLVVGVLVFFVVEHLLGIILHRALAYIKLEVKELEGKKKKR